MKPRKILLLFVPALLLLGAVYLGLKIWSTAQAKEKIHATTQYLPTIHLRKTDGGILLTDSFHYKKELLVLNYFNPDCDHCLSMVQEMFRQKSVLQNVHWLMITTNTTEKTKRFVDSMNLSQLPMVTVLNDTSFQFMKAFGSVSVPSFYVYKNGELLRRHSGECSIAYLLQP
jgi:peroxiredoxin